jgi:subtilisin family serine protease
MKKIAFWIPLVVLTFALGWQLTDQLTSQSQRVSADEPNAIIVRYRNNTRTAKSMVSAMGVDQDQVVVQDLGIFRYQVAEKSRASDVLEQIRDLPEVKWAQFDHPVTQRRTPDDPRFSQQWGLKKIQASEAWKTTTGAPPVGAIAVIDGGFDLDHKDLKDKYWKFAGEIAGNNLDDDGNGYVDDVNGWNAYEDNGNIQPDYHGSHVAGIAGAASDNGLQMTGVDWGAKILPIAGASGVTSTVLRAYGYVLKQKQLWISSGGRKGVNVLITNSSFGSTRLSATTEISRRGTISSTKWARSAFSLLPRRSMTTSTLM